MLKLYVGDELVELTTLDLIHDYIGEGYEARIFWYGDEVLKLYKKRCKKDRLDEDTAIKLSKLSTSRILLPKKMIYDSKDKEFVGYTLKRIQRKRKKDILNRPMRHFVNELDRLNEDLLYLANNGVEVEDFHLGNCLYDGRIFIGDPGDFIIKEESVEGGIYRNNLYTLNRFVKDEIFGMVRLNIFERNAVEDRFEDFEFIGEQLRDTYKTGETVKSYVKRMVR